MNYKLSQCLGVILLLLATINLSAQQDTSIYIQDMQVDPAEVINVDVRVTGYQDIVSTSFSIFWDSMDFRYVGIENIPFGLSEDNDFGTMNASSGEVSFLYFDMSLGGNSLDDDAILFTLQLEVTGPDGTQSEVTFGGNIEVVDADGVNNNTPLNVNFDGGLITIGEPNSVIDIAAQALEVDIVPNPSAQNVNVMLMAKNGGDLNWTLTEVNGQQIATGVTNVAPGRNTLELENTLFKHIGAYILKIQLDDQVITRRILRVAP
ncbi:MAG: T9SS type A sorting domain-containing protein [Bacteroidota bacterium]